jgi:dTDP-4-dehydrorhamnose reductase
MRVLVIGATGLLGRVLLEAGDDIQITGASSRDADIRNPDQLTQLIARRRPEWTVLAAAYTDVDGCEKNPEHCNDVNYRGALNVARATAAAGSKLLFVSTDYVFDGTSTRPYEPDDTVCPMNVYGHSKALAEEGIRQILPDACIVRTSWLFGAVGNCFPNKILELAQSRSSISVVADQIGCPTFNRDLSHIILRLMHSGAGGTVHATNSNPCSWYEFAKAILKTAGKTDVAVTPVGTENFPRPARRPKYSVLSTVSLAGFGIYPRPWQETLKDYFLDRNLTLAEAQHLTRGGSQ